MKHVAMMILGLSLVGCATGQVDRTRADSAHAVLRNAQGEEKAQAIATQVGDGVRISLKASGMAAGTYGVHVHAIGRCEAPDFRSAGAHWNPTSRQHGKDNPQGMHMGDLPNLVVGADGRGSVDYVIAAATLKSGATPMLDPDGASVMIHSTADDYVTDPSGNSGGRIACGVLD